MYKPAPWRGKDERGRQAASGRRDLRSRRLRADRPVHRAVPDDVARRSRRPRESPDSNGTKLYLATVAASELSDPHPSWVSYYVVDAKDQNWRHATTFELPANSLVHVTIYQFDGQSGLRNPFIAQATGIVGGTFGLNGKPTMAIDPDAASHIFAIPQMGVSVPLYGIPDDSKEPVRQRALPAEHRPRDDHVHVPHAGQGSVPLAVLRPVRGRLHPGLRWADADGRLHGRLHQGCLRTRPGERGQSLPPRRPDLAGVERDHHADRGARRPGDPAGRRHRAGRRPDRPTTPCYSGSRRP